MGDGVKATVESGHKYGHRASFDNTQSVVLEVLWLANHDEFMGPIGECEVIDHRAQGESEVAAKVGSAHCNDQTPRG